jgi:histidine triad (HIT) family protein
MTILKKFRYNKFMNTDPNCVFCKIVAGEIPAEKVFENEDFLAFLDIKPNNLGHTLLIPKTHCQNIFEMPDEILAKLGRHLQIIASAVLKGAEATGVNIGMNNGATAGQLVWHAHLHLIPRYVGDGLKHWNQKDGFTPEDFKQMAAKIRENISEQK